MPIMRKRLMRFHGAMILLRVLVRWARIRGLALFTIAGSQFAEGVRQRAAREKSDANSKLVPSALALYLVELWSWGLLSPQRMQIFMAKFQEDLANAAAGTLSMVEVDRLASLGARGIWSSNASRDLKNQLQTPKLQEARHGFIAPMRSHFDRLTVADHQQETINDTTRSPHYLWHCPASESNCTMKMSATRLQGQRQSHGYLCGLATDKGHKYMR